MLCVRETNFVSPVLVKQCEEILIVFVLFQYAVNILIFRAKQMRIVLRISVLLGIRKNKCAWDNV